jgi:hypothetical protein
MVETPRKTKAGERVAFTFAEFAEKIGKHRSWVYRMVGSGKIRAITGYGAAMIPASEIERIFGNSGGVA